MCLGVEENARLVTLAPRGWLFQGGELVARDSKPPGKMPFEAHGKPALSRTRDAKRFAWRALSPSTLFIDGMPTRIADCAEVDAGRSKPRPYEELRRIDLAEVGRSVLRPHT
jgi:hypothetical protein